MSLKLIHKELSLPVERMLQGLAYYIAFNECTQGGESTEGTYVEEAQKILTAELGKQQYRIKRELHYSEIVGIQSREEADLAIIKKETEEVICVLEFKLSSDTNGGIYKDLNKMKVLPDSIDRLSILLFLHPKPRLKGKLMDPVKLIAKKGKRVMQNKKYLKEKTYVHIRRVAKAMPSAKTKNPFMAVCISLD